MSETFVTVKEAAAILGVSTATLRSWDSKGKLTARRHPVNKYRMYEINDIRKFSMKENIFNFDKNSTINSDKSNIRSIKRVISSLNVILRDSDGKSNIVQRFDEITKLIFIKVMSDRSSKYGISPLSGSERNSSDIRTYYEQLIKNLPFFIPSEFSYLKCSDEAVLRCIDVLDSAYFSDTDFDVAGLAYEEVIRNTFDKSDNQQFFTPPQIVDFIVSACEADLTEEVCDPACGTGGFLAAVARRGLPFKSLTGIEIDERLSWSAGMNVFLHGGRHAETILLPDGGTLGNGAKPYFGRFNAIITNPPFGSDLSDPQLLRQFCLGNGRQSRRRGILFIERCWELLRPKGMLAIIIDEGVLNLPHAEDVRGYILKHFDVEAVVSLPESAFQPYATVNASILFLRKRYGSGRVTSPNGPVYTFFARAHHVGRKANGDDDIVYSRTGDARLNSDLPKILEDMRQARCGVTDNFGSSYVADIHANLYDVSEGTRLDYQFHHPSRQEVRRKIESCAYPLIPLHELCAERTQAVVPAQEFSGTTIPYTGLAQIESNTGRSVQEQTPADSLKSQVRPYEAGDILFAKMRPNLRKVALMEFDEPGYASPECSVLVPKKDGLGNPIVDPLVLSVLLRSDFIYGQIVHLVAGIGRPRISPKALRTVLIPVPPPEVQAAIKEEYLEQQQEAEILEEKAAAIQNAARIVIANAVSTVSKSFAKSRETA